MKVSEAITRARALLSDLNNEYWADDTLLLKWYNDGVITLRKQRTDTQFDVNGRYMPFSTATNATTDDMIFAEAEVWVIAVADYIAFRGFGEDAGDKRDLERSGYHWQRFSNTIVML